MKPLATDIHMSYMWREVTRLATGYNMRRKYCKWIKKLFFHSADLAIMDALIIVGEIYPTIESETSF
jgi:hypothetical protein